MRRPAARRPATLAALLPGLLAVAALSLSPVGWAARPATPNTPNVPNTLRILTLNAEHHMSAERFQAWRAFCEPHGWRDPEARDRPEHLTYCNALDGTDGRGRRLFAAIHDDAMWRQKVDQLRALIRAADADIVLLQEVADGAAARLLLGDAYRVASSAELWRGHAIAQNLAFGWRSTLPGPAPKVALVEAISQAGADGRRTRPGLALTVEPQPGRPLAILNLHLKAGCRHGRFDQATSRNPRRSFKREADCSVFQQQVPAIEDWADAALAKGNGVIIAGDFNRHLLREIKDRMPARSDGSDPAGPANPDRIASLVAEISDKSPPAAWFSLVRNGPYRKLADCHRSIDNFLLSANLGDWLALPLRQLKVRILPFAEPVSLDRARPSDHCPHLLELRFNGPG